MKIFLLQTVLAVAAFAVCAGASEACPAKVPPGLAAQPVGQDVVTNGLPMSIWEVTTKEAPAAALERVEHEWKDAKFDVRRTRSGGWSVVSALSDDCLATLQLTDKPGVPGYFSVSQPARATVSWVSKRMQVALPADVAVASAVSSADGGRRGHTVAFTSRRTVEDLGAYFMSQLPKAGWKSVSAHELRDPRHHRSARIVTGQKGSELVSVVLWNQDATRGLLNVSEAP